VYIYKKIPSKRSLERIARADFMKHFPRFGQDRVNFHQNPGRDTAGGADPTWPNRAGCSILPSFSIRAGTGTTLTH